MRRRLLSYGLAVVSLAVLAWIARSHLGELGRLSEVPAAGVAGLAALFLVGRGLGGLLIRIGLSALGHRVALRTCVMLTIVQSYTNLAVPRTGLAPGAVYLRMRHGVPYASYISFAVASLLIATSLVGATGSVLWWGLRDAIVPALRPELGAAFAAISLLAASGVLAPARLYALLPVRLRETLSAAHDAWLRLARQPLVLLRIVLVQLVTIFLRAVKVKVAFAAAGAELPFGLAMLVSVCADVATLISITPAALGFREGGLLFGAALVGIEPGTALLAAVVERITTTATTLVAGQLVLWRGLHDYWRGVDEEEAAPAPGGAPR